MQYTLVLAAAALAQAHEHAHGRFHHKRDVETKVEMVYETVTQYVTAGSTSTHRNNWHNGGWPQHTTVKSSSEEPSATVVSSSAAVPSSSSPSSSSSSSTTSDVVEPTSESSSAAPVAYTSTSAESSSSSSSYSAPASSTSAAPASGSGISSITGGKKAGLSGYVGIQNIVAFSSMAPYISWYSDYTPNTPDSNGVKGVGMLWGASGSSCGGDLSERLSTFTSMMSANTVPDIMFGFYEPDCSCPDSSDMTSSAAAVAWDSLIAPLAAKGTILGSPSMCKQLDEDFLTPFNDAISTSWDVTSIHVNKPSVEEAKADVEYYVNTYGKPVWVSEFACVDDSNGWAPCTDQDQINEFITGVVSYFEGNDNVVAYGPSNGNGLGDVWPLTDSSTGSLTTSGQTYLDAIKNL